MRADGVQGPNLIFSLLNSSSTSIRCPGRAVDEPHTYAQALEVPPLGNQKPKSQVLGVHLPGDCQKPDKLKGVKGANC